LHTAALPSAAWLPSTRRSRPRHDAAPFAVGIPERRQVVHGLRFGIDGLRPPVGSLHQYGSATSAVGLARPRRSCGCGALPAVLDSARHSNGADSCARDYRAVHSIDDGIAKRSAALNASPAHP
jgi:hypothetical protein